MSHPDTSTAPTLVDAPLSNVPATISAIKEVAEKPSHLAKTESSAESDHDAIVKSKSHDVDATAAGAEDAYDPTKHYLSGVKMFTLLGGLLLSVFLIALDQTILAPALPIIASKWQALDQLAWISAGFFITQAPFVLIYGQVLLIARTKITFLIAIGLFEIGSIICSAAPNVEVLIFGRAFAGVGAGGIFVSVLTIISQTIPIEKRGAAFGGFGALWGLSSVIGPLLGGAFTDSKTVQWRACFWINVPIGALTVAAVFFILDSLPSPADVDPNDNRTTLQRWMSIDWIGATLILGLTACLVLALSWGGVTKPWNSGAVIACFVVFAVLIPVLIAWAWRRGETAIIPLSMFRNRLVVGVVLQVFFMFFALIAFIYYLPIEYQAVKGSSATKSGIDILPFMLTVVGGTMLAGTITTLTGNYWWAMIVPPMVLVPIGAGLFRTTDAYTSRGKLAGLQVLIGFGLGFGLQQGMMAIQAGFHGNEKGLPVASGIASFCNLIGGVIGIAVSQVLLTNGLKKYLPMDLPTDVREGLLKSVQVIHSLSGTEKILATEGYVSALKDVYIIAVPAAILSAGCALMIPSLNMKKMGINPAAGAA